MDMLGHWFAGLAAGEGCFIIAENKPRGKRRTSTYTCQFVLALHVVDAPILTQLQGWLGAGRLSPQADNMLRWAIQDAEGHKKLIEALDTYPLRAAKQRDYETWKRAVLIKQHRRYGDSWEPIAALKQELERNRRS